MKAHIDKVLVVAGNANRYQYIITIIAMIVLGVPPFFSVTLAFLEAQPNVTLYPNTPKNITVVLNYSLCDITDKIIHSDQLHYSWTNELGIQCEKLQTSLLGTITSFGFVLGSSLSSTVILWLGERKTLLISLALYTVILTASIFISNYYFFCFTTLTCCFFSNLGIYTSIVLLNEVIDRNKKALFSILMLSGFGLGSMLYFGLFYFLQNWRYVFWFTIGVAVVLEAVIAAVLIDSPLKSVMNNDFDTFMKIMRFIAKVNGRLEIFESEVGNESYMNEFKRLLAEETENEEVKESVTEAFGGKTVPSNALDDSLVMRRDSINKKEKGIQAKPKQIVKRENAIICIFKYKSVRILYILFSFFWFSNSCLSYGLAINLKFLLGSIYLNGILMFTLEVVAYIVSGFIINSPRLGRKGSAFLFHGGLAVCLALYVIFFDNYTVSIVFYIISRFFVIAGYSLYMSFFLESYPNSIKATAFALNAMWNSFGGMVVPFFIEYIPSFPLFTGFTVLWGVNSLLVFFLKETLGKEQSDEIIEIKQKMAKEKEKEIDINQPLNEVNELS